MRVAVLAISHLNKSGGPAMYRTMGSLAFVAAARAAWGIVKDTDNPVRRLMLPIKNNLAADTTGGMAYTIVSSEAGVPYLAWEPEPIHVSADEVMGDKEATARAGRQEAKEWLRRLLAHGPVEAEGAEQHAHAEGIPERTLKRAKRELGVISYKEGFGPGATWYWKLPEATDEEPEEDQRGP